jgi:four helix bundle protein
MVDFTKIIAWQKAHAFTMLVYSVANKFPDYERHGLFSQFTRAAVSIAVNIAEGTQKLTKADKLRFFNISQGSLSECRYYIILSRDLGYINAEEFNLLTTHFDATCYFLNKYIEGIEKNNGIKDNF